jgi:hypothetical protein
MLRSTECPRLIFAHIALIRLRLLQSQPHILQLYTHIGGDKVTDLSHSHAAQRETIQHDEKESMEGETCLLSLRDSMRDLFVADGPSLNYDTQCDTSLFRLVSLSAADVR